jgi:hypothetical protein
MKAAQAAFFLVHPMGIISIGQLFRQAIKQNTPGCRLFFANSKPPLLKVPPRRGWEFVCFYVLLKVFTPSGRRNKNSTANCKLHTASPDPAAKVAGYGVSDEISGLSRSEDHDSSCDPNADYSFNLPFVNCLIHSLTH